MPSVLPEVEAALRDVFADGAGGVCVAQASTKTAAEFLASDLTPQDMHLFVDTATSCGLSVSTAVATIIRHALPLGIRDWPGARHMLKRMCSHRGKWVDPKAWVDLIVAINSMDVGGCSLKQWLKTCSDDVAALQLKPLLDATHDTWMGLNDVILPRMIDASFTVHLMDACAGLPEACDTSFAGAVATYLMFYHAFPDTLSWARGILRSGVLSRRRRPQSLLEALAVCRALEWMNYSRERRIAAADAVQHNVEYLMAAAGMVAAAGVSVQACLDNVKVVRKITDLWWRNEYFTFGLEALAAVYRRVRCLGSSGLPSFLAAAESTNLPHTIESVLDMVRQGNGPLRPVTFALARALAPAAMKKLEDVE